MYALKLNEIVSRKNNFMAIVKKYPSVLIRLRNCRNKMSALARHFLIKAEI